MRPPSWRLPLGSSDTRANSCTFGSLSLDLQSGQGLRIFPHIPPTRGSSGRPNTAAKRRSQLPSLHGVQLYSGVLIPVVIFPPGGRNSRLLAGVVRESSPTHQHFTPEFSVVGIALDLLPVSVDSSSFARKTDT